MLDHVDFEVSRERLRDCVEFYEALGFYEAEPPEDLTIECALLVHEQGCWLGLLVMDEPVVMPWGHIALAVADYPGTVELMRARGVEVEDRRPYWGAARSFLHDPQGNRVELLEFGPSFEPRPPPGGVARMLR